MADELETIRRLISSKKGDPIRLNRILELIKDGNTVLEADKTYLDSLLSTATFEDEKEAEVTFDDLKEEVKLLREKLAKQEKLTDQVSRNQKKKSMNTTTLLAVIFGAFGICGIGHFYAEKKLIGTLILIGGLFILLLIVGGWNILNDPYTIHPDPARAFNVVVVLVLMYLVLYGFQIFHARHYCGKYNELIEKYDL